MKKIYILDTNVLIHDPRALFNFQDNDVIVPILVLEELDKLKKLQTEAGKQARLCSRVLDGLRETGSLFDGITLPKGGVIRVDMRGNIDILPENFRKDLYDNRILALVYEIHKKQEGVLPVVLVTKDINLRIKSDALGIVSQDYTTDKISYEEQYSGVATIEVEEDIIDYFYSNGEVNAADVFDEDRLEYLYPNEFVTLISKYSPTKQALTQFHKNKGKLKRLEHADSAIWGISANNREQRYAVELLLNKDIRLVTLVGKAGTGKTLVALAAGLEQVIETEEYKRLFVARPIMPMGQ
ncbi:MAG: PIN domain-containing protein, partial [Fusobacteria bacterium]|nr:PIN domain-containing protein [Fusobacteriota bacterium]